VAGTTDPSSSADWTIHDIDTVTLTACEDKCRIGEVCRSSDNSCVAPDATNTCTGCTSQERCIGGSCTPIDLLPPFRDLPKARGLWPAVRALTDGTVMIAYYDRVSHALQVNVTDPSNGAQVRSTAIDGIGAGTQDDAGLYPSLYITPGGEIHLAYMNASQRSLMYRTIDISLTTQLVEEIDSGLDTGVTPSGSLIGADPALVVDTNGTVRVAFQDATLGLLRYATRNGPDDWTVVTLRGDEEPYEGSFGFYTDQTLDRARANPKVSTYRFFLSATPEPLNGLEVVTPP
jgi:hypothetical protein